MSSQSPSRDRDEALSELMGDFRLLFSFEEIKADEFENVLSELKSDEVKRYLEYLRDGSRPEVALREAFLAGDSLLARSLFGRIEPEIRVRSGFVDYRILGTRPNRFVVLELKSLFEAIFVRRKGGTRDLQRIRRVALKPELHKSQIVKYIREGGEFVVLTNLKDWTLFNESTTYSHFEPFHSAQLQEVSEDLGVIKDFTRYLERKEADSAKEGLDKRFFKSLESWVERLSDVEFEVDERTRTELIIGIINKFIFVQTLDDYGVVDFRWIKETWDHAEKRWRAKGKIRVLETFFREVEDFFWQHYDTELFRRGALQYVTRTEENISRFYQGLKTILGLVYWQSEVGGYLGILQYNFRLIDEDIFGKAYETFLADVRHEEGIYYTPRHITEYIVENTVGRSFRAAVKEIQVGIEDENLDLIERHAKRLITIRVLDPACGSGSFLIKAIKTIWEIYKELDVTLAEFSARYNRFEGTLERSEEVEQKSERLREIRELLGAQSDRELVSHILIRHIHANDLDSKALAVAKVNVWLEAIKLAAREFRYDSLPEGTNFVLPHLEMNFRNGDSVVGLPTRLAVDFLEENHKEEISRMSRLRSEYLKTPTDPNLVLQIVESQRELRTLTDRRFAEYLQEKSLSLDIAEQTIPFHWPLEMWYLYFDEEGNPVETELAGADVVIGNPPYERVQVLNKKHPSYKPYLDASEFDSTTGNYDLASVFVERGFGLLNQNGQFGYIVTNKFIEANYGKGIRKIISDSKSLRELVNFGHEQIFEGEASTYTCLLFLSKAPRKSFKFAQIKTLTDPRMQLVAVQAKEEAEDASTVIGVLGIESISEEPWVLVVGGDRALTEELLGLEPTLGDISERISQGFLTSADRIYIVRLIEATGSITRVHSAAVGGEFELESEILRPLVKGKDIGPFFIEYAGRLVIFPFQERDGRFELMTKETLGRDFPKLYAYFTRFESELRRRERGKWDVDDRWYSYSRPQNLDLFPAKKIVTPFNAFSASFAFDEEGLYFTAGVAGGYGITIKEGIGLGTGYLVGVLNSSLIGDFLLRKVSTPLQGGYYSYEKRFIERLPIKIPIGDANRALAESIESAVTDVTKLRESRSVILSSWQKVSVRLKNNTRSLMDILIDDAANARSGDSRRMWTTSVSFYPGKDEQSTSEEFKGLQVRSNGGAQRLIIYGTDDENQEQRLYEMKFGSGDLMLLSYFSMLSLLGSRAKVRTLKDLWEKTLVPVIEPDVVANSPHILEGLRHDLDEGGVTGVFKGDLAKIDEEILDVEAQIDAAVSYLYGLSPPQIDLVLRSLDRPASYRAKVSTLLADLGN